MILFSVAVFFSQSSAVSEEVAKQLETLRYVSVTIIEYTTAAVVLYCSQHSFMHHVHCLNFFVTPQHREGRVDIEVCISISGRFLRVQCTMYITAVPVNIHCILTVNLMHTFLCTCVHLSCVCCLHAHGVYLEL